MTDSIKQNCNRLVARGRQSLPPTKHILFYGGQVILQILICPGYFNLAIREEKSDQSQTLPQSVFLKDESKYDATTSTIVKL